MIKVWMYEYSVSKIVLMKQWFVSALSVPFTQTNVVVLVSMIYEPKIQTTQTKPFGFVNTFDPSDNGLQ